MKLLQSTAGQGILFLLVAVLLRASTFGDPNLHVDETFYQAIGIAMHHGAVPYVDVWDRKPWGLFFLYYLIAAISYSPLAYQLVATAFCALTALVIARIASLWARPTGAVLAGVAYLVWLEQQQGFSGQAPVFYNLLIATAGWLTIRSEPALRAGRVPVMTFVAMLLGGIAITIKQTTLFEAGFFGLFSAVTLWRAQPPRAVLIRTVALWVLLGVLPFALISAWYFASGFGDIYYHAMVTSNLAKEKDASASLIRLLLMFIWLAPFIVFTVMGMPNWGGRPRSFVLCWLGAALLGLLSVQAFYLHHGLPLLVPLCVASAALLSGRYAGPIAIAVLLGLAARDTQVFDFDHAKRSRADLDRLVATIQRHDHGAPLFIYEGPYALYQRTGQKFLSPLVFAHHFSHRIEKDVSHLSTRAELERVLALRPGTVVLPPSPRQSPANEESEALVRGYVAAHCRHVARLPSPDWLVDNVIDVWAECYAEGQNRTRKPPNTERPSPG